MKDRLGAPGTGLSRRAFLATTSGVGTAALAGCQVLSAQVNVRSGSKVNHVTNGNVYPGGMFTGVVYKDAMKTDIFSQLMQYAGYQ